MNSSDTETDEDNSEETDEEPIEEDNENDTDDNDDNDESDDSDDNIDEDNSNNDEDTDENEDELNDEQSETNENQTISLQNGVEERQKNRLGLPKFHQRLVVLCRFIQINTFRPNQTTLLYQLKFNGQSELYMKPVPQYNAWSDQKSLFKSSPPEFSPLSSAGYPQSLTSNQLKKLAQNYQFVPQEHWHPLVRAKLTRQFSTRPPVTTDIQNNTMPSHAWTELWRVFI